jgi:predicted Zn finger-like uncharacterized protein
MAGIVWLTCPNCAFRFYIIDDDAGQGFEWFCPKCQHRFTEAESADRSEPRARRETPPSTERSAAGS